MAFDKNKSISRAQKFIAAGKVDNAIGEYLEIVKNDSKDVSSLQKLAGLYAKKKAFDEAVQCYEKVGQSFHKSGFYQRAVAVYKLALQHQPENARLMMALGELYQTLGLKSEALQNLRGAVQTLSDQDKYADALVVLEQMVEMSPDDPSIKARYGEALFHAGKKAEGVAVFRELSGSLATDGKWDDLARFHERILSMDPTDHGIRKELAKTYVRLGLAPKALKHLKILFDANKADAEVFDLVGRVYVLMGKNQKAVSAFMEKIHHLKDTEEIEKTYQRILEIDPTNEDALRFLGGEDDDITEFGMNDEPEPAQVITVRTDESNAYSQPSDRGGVSGSNSEASQFAAAINEASVYMKYGIVDRAIEQLKQIIDKDPDNIQALERLAAAYEESGEQSGLVEVLVQLAEIHEGLGEMGKAGEMIGRAEKVDHHHPRLRAFRGESEEDTVLQETSHGLADGEGSDDILADVLLGEEPSFDDDGEAFLDADEFVDDAFLDDEGAAVEAAEAPAEDSSADDGSIEIDMDFDDASADSDSFVDGVKGGPDSEIDLDLDEQESDVSLSAVEEDLDGSIETDSDTAASDEIDDAFSPFTGLDKGIESSVDIPIEPDESIFEEEKPFQEDLEHAQFFLEQGLFDEAEQIVEQLQDEYPQEAAVRDLARKLELTRPKPASDSQAQEKDTSSGNFSFYGEGFDLAGELEAELGFLEDENIAPGEEDVPTLEEIFDEFKKGVKEQLSDSDGAAHYDLGIAYLEMGLTTDAISEFEIASRTPEKKIDSYTMIAVARRKLGDSEGARDAYEEVFSLENLPANVRLNICFELAGVYEDLKDYRNAIRYYKEVVAIDKDYRKVMDKVKQLKETLAKK